MKFENFPGRINSLNDIEKFEKETIKKQELHRFVILGSRMEKSIIQKSKYAQISDKRFYFSDGIVSLPFSHASLKTLIDYKEEKGQRIE